MPSKDNAFSKANTQDETARQYFNFMNTVYSTVDCGSTTLARKHVTVYSTVDCGSTTLARKHV